MIFKCLAADKPGAPETAARLGWDGRESARVAGSLCLAVRSGTLHDEIERLRKFLGEPEASPTGRLLIDQVVICYLRLNVAEQYYDTTMTDGCSLAAASYWERKLSTVQYRYHLRAFESLARVRKLMGLPMVHRVRGWTAGREQRSSWTRPPVYEQGEEVGQADVAVAIEIWRTAGVGSPLCEQGE